MCDTQKHLCNFQKIFIKKQIKSVINTPLRVNKLNAIPI